MAFLYVSCLGVRAINGSGVEGDGCVTPRLGSYRERLRRPSGSSDRWRPNLYPVNGALVIQIFRGIPDRLSEPEIVITEISHVATHV